MIKNTSKTVWQVCLSCWSADLEAVYSSRLWFLFCPGSKVDAGKQHASDAASQQSNTKELRCVDGVLHTNSVDTDDHERDNTLRHTATDSTEDESSEEEPHNRRTAPGAKKRIDVSGSQRAQNQLDRPRLFSAAPTGNQPPGNSTVGKKFAQGCHNRSIVAISGSGRFAGPVNQPADYERSGKIFARSENEKPRPSSHGAQTSAGMRSSLSVVSVFLRLPALCPLGFVYNLVCHFISLAYFAVQMMKNISKVRTEGHGRVHAPIRISIT